MYFHVDSYLFCLRVQRLHSFSLRFPWCFFQAVPFGVPTFAPFHTQSVRIFAVVRKTSNKFPDFLDSFMRISKYYTANYLSFRRHVHKILSELRKIQQHFKGRCIFQKPPENFDFSKSARKIGSASREFGSFSPSRKARFANRVHPRASLARGRSWERSSRPPQPPSRCIPRPAGHSVFKVFHEI